MTFLNFTFQDPSPLISYSDGQWVEGSPTNDTLASEYSQGSFKVTFTAGATATLNFLGDSITIYGAKRPNHGNYSVVLDNEPEFIGDGSDGNNTFQFPLWNAQNLTYGQHTVELTNIPTSQGKFLDMDFISIGREIGPSGYNGPIHNVMIDDELPFFVYNGSWSPSFSTTALNSSLHSATDEGASVSFFFQGSSVELYGLYVNAPFQAQVDDQLPRNLAGPNVDLNAQEEHPQTLLYYMDGLDESKTHTVTLTNTVSNPGRPLFIDYAIVRGSQAFFGNTPSPNSGFTVPTSTSTSANTHTSASSSTNSGSPAPVGAIVGGVVGGVGGLIVLAFIGFILFRRSRFYRSSRSANNEEEGNVRVSIMTRESRSGASGITPFILPDSTPSFQTPGTSANTIRKNRLDTRPLPIPPPEQQSYSPPHSTTGSRYSQTSSQDHLTFLPSPTSNAPPPIILGGPTGQPHGNNLITQTYILQESDAGRIVHARLPPMYNDSWQPSSPS